MRWIPLLVVVLAITAQAGCESCAWTYGSLDVEGHLTIKGPVPADLAVKACNSPRGDDCHGEATVTDDLGEGFSYTAGTESTGYFTCDFEDHWVVVTGTGCEPIAFDMWVVDMRPLVGSYDITLHCDGAGPSSDAGDE